MSTTKRTAWNAGKGKTADPRECPGCKHIFVPKFKKRNQKYCSKACAGKVGIAARFPVLHSPTARAKNRESQIKAKPGLGKTYRKLFGRHEHRVVAEIKLGRPLLRYEVVHHIDGDHLNNDPSNLEVMTQAEHMQRHGIGIPGNPLTWKPWNSRKKRSADVDHIQTSS